MIIKSFNISTYFMQKNFRMWLEVEEDYDDWKSVITGYLNLDPKNGLSEPLDTFNADNLKSKLQGLGKFANLPVDLQNKIFGMIDGPQGGTVGDLIRTMASEPKVRI